MAGGDVIRGPWPGSGEDRPVGSQNHPAGRRRGKKKPPPAAVPDIEFRWRSEYPSTVEQRRAAALAAKPRCLECDRPFNTRSKPPADLICKDCRIALLGAQAAAEDGDIDPLF
ncbi:hypothetical protein SEA_SALLYSPECIAL_21 [Gordonia phage SallySpecial]|uniref:Uncharacterized protein n=1 Tax=Gordonia phage SallySpecial TaxID=2079570 RepID=A0A2P1CC07_9CAUD|nr:hypothetical protein PQC62_gp21 [Gordonia phage SallySpecial]AVJ48769.1 hypothetical protein SEA_SALLYSPECIAL_21 [Gordonia phage SallySpecial]